MLLSFTDELIVVPKFDREMAVFPDTHYSRQKPGTNQFMPPGFTIVIRNWQGTLLFGWLKQLYRDDDEKGYCCTIFKNESSRRSSDAILECEQKAFDRWGLDRVFTYVDPKEIKSPNPGFCFKEAGWKFIRRTKDGKHLLAKAAMGVGR